MPSPLHEVLIEMFRERPVLAAQLLADQLGVDIPEFDQVQPVALLVVCPDPSVATWAGTPIVVGNPGFVLTPTVLGPATLPVITDPAVGARAPELVVLSALAHAERADPPDQRLLLEALVVALMTVDAEHGSLYYDIVGAALREATRKDLEALMSIATWRPLSDFARRYYDQGEAEGEARGEARGKAAAVLTVLDARGIEVPDELRSRIIGCADIAQLDLWLQRAASAKNASDL